MSGAASRRNVQRERLEVAGRRTWSPTAAQVASSREVLLVDVAGRKPGRVASEIARVLQGKHRPNYVGHMNTGDGVVVINSSSLVLSATRQRELKYRHSGFPGGIKSSSNANRFARSSAEYLRETVAGMLPKTKLHSLRMKKLKVYPGGSHPHHAQLLLPTRWSGDSLIVIRRPEAGLCDDEGHGVAKSDRARMVSEEPLGPPGRGTRRIERTHDGRVSALAARWEMEEDTHWVWTPSALALNDVLSRIHLAMSSCIGSGAHEIAVGVDFGSGFHVSEPTDFNSVGQAVKSIIQKNARSGGQPLLVLRIEVDEVAAVLDNFTPVGPEQRTRTIGVVASGATGDALKSCLFAATASKAARQLVSDLTSW